MSAPAGIGNWHAALANNLPDEMDELRAEVADLDRKKADKLSLLADYEELLAIARRRVAVTPAVASNGHLPEARYLSGSECAA
jgi:hypothetical protein